MALIDPGYPPPPGSIGIMDLGENPKLNLGAQSLRGKIFVSKSLAAPHRRTEFHDGTPRVSARRHDLDHDDDPIVAVNARSDVTQGCAKRKRLKAPNPNVPSIFAFPDS